MAVEHPTTLLRHLAGEFHRQKSTAKSIDGPKGHQRRLHTQGLEELQHAFESVLTHWVPDAPQRDAWRAHFYHFASAPPPSEPESASPPLYKGVDPLGRTIEIRAASDAAYDIVVDGHSLRHSAEPLRLSSRRLRALHIEGMDFTESFEAPEEAQQALEEYFAAPVGAAPWPFAPSLYEDGLIDIHFSLTERGRRLVDERRHGPETGAEVFL